MASAPTAPADANFWRTLLRRYRFTHNVKQADLAYDLGVTQAMVSRWEAGAVRPAADMQARIRALTGSTDDMSAPLVGWRKHVACQPDIAAVIDRDGLIETASTGLARETGLSRDRIEGRTLASLFAGDLVALQGLLIDRGFFDGALESVESADRYCFANSHGKRDIGPVHGLHWPHAGEDNTVRWMLTGARVTRLEFDHLRSEFGGQVGSSGQG
ncbi:helix-turn-helix domain-containing protein [uncultured Maricaulis sp.]|uniref:helix-turn-helix domain-containing protein n=1 Tax=uncultured Maricaulis sp. TaxID=174710 RepID=UPI0025ED01B1|nr:helix-turn-helix domain-containing protein [uncultured Maricaulis sp.]